MLRRKRLQPISERQRAARAAEGDVHLTTTFRRKPAGNGEPGRQAALSRSPAPRKRPRYTGPKKSTNALVDDRSGKQCEWPDCNQPQEHRHHRLNRKAGGRKREGKVRVNGAAWLLGACYLHHAYVTSPSGERRKVAERMGWLLREHQDATRVAVQTRHDAEPVWLTNDGEWHHYEEGAA